MHFAITVIEPKPKKRVDADRQTRDTDPDVLAMIGPIESTSLPERWNIESLQHWIDLCA